MTAEMTPGSNYTLLFSRREAERNCCTVYRQQKPRSEKICHISGSRTKNLKHPKSLCLRTCLTFCFKGRTKMEQPQMDSFTEGTEGRLRELASKWFVETQVPLIIHNGFFPSWFRGFITRKDAEEILKEKEVGCFLIRLSDKAIGYILSYKGRDRCRHFVINQSEAGHFAVCGDTNRHGTVSDLIEFYKTRPIQPFGEYLTSSCFEELNEELYDIIQVNPKEKPVAAVRAVKSEQRQHTNVASEHTPTQTPKNNKTLEAVPPLPRRSRHFDSAPLNDQDGVLYAYLNKQSSRETPRSQNMEIIYRNNPRKTPRSTTLQQNEIRRCSPPSSPDCVYSELSLLAGSKSRSLPLLDSTSEREQYYRLSAPPQTPPRLCPKPNRQATSYVPPSEESCSHSLDYISDSAVYHLAGRPGSPHATSSETRSMTSGHHCNSVYAEVSNEALCPQDNTYELIPGNEDKANAKPNSNMYEPLEEIRPKPTKNDNGKWKWLFPDAKRKW
ncbi:SH2 domain-containing protein 7-like [Anabas testudineus]|uniref:SH2 domain-containing protein n=1 Tax=Anabas testudineus TaxID=64144 RepID=A0A3Q1HTK8_ANATE|nr:SH2 domain-containing protein 7-like [Anabas testudineus]